jgi:hypothetical protein
VTAELPMSSTCDSYPRMIPEVLDPGDVEYLKQLYYCRERPDDLLYYSLLRRCYDYADSRLDRIFERIHQVVDERIGDDFVAVNDFYSYRRPGVSLFPVYHVDYEFWMTDRKDGFNIWILLDHCEHDVTFDVLTKDNNAALYEIFGATMPPGFLIRHPNTSTYSAFKVNPSPFTSERGALFRFPWLPILLEKKIDRKKVEMFQMVESSTLRREQFKFPGIGSGFVVRQEELHATERDPLKAHQFRLGVGFKFMRRDIVRRLFGMSPAGISRRFLPSIALSVGDMLRPYYLKSASGLAGPISIRQGSLTLARQLGIAPVGKRTKL